YVGQSFFFLAALNSIPLSTATLLLLIYPALVLVGAVLMGRERVTASRLAALVLSLLGCLLVIGGPGQGGDAPWISLARTSSLISSGSILSGARVLRVVDPLVASGYLIASAGLGFVALSLAFAAFAWRMTSGAWLAIFVVAWFCTVVGVTGLLS